MLELLPVDAAAAREWPALLSGWSALTVPMVIFILTVAVTHTIGSTASVKSYQLADAGKIAPLEYTYLVYAPVWDYLIFQNPPTPLVLAGMTLIAAGGVIVSWREGRPARPKPQNYGEYPWVAERKLDKSIFGTRIELGLKVSRPKQHP